MVCVCVRTGAYVCARARVFARTHSKGIEGEVKTRKTVGHFIPRILTAWGAWRHLWHHLAIKVGV